MENPCQQFLATVDGAVERKRTKENILNKFSGSIKLNAG